jgi:hypothetical protein
MGNHPKVTVFGYDPGRNKVDCMVGDDFMAVPITLKSSRVPTAGETIVGPSLWIRSSLTPFYAFPYMYGGVVASVSGETKVTFLNSGEAAHFTALDKVSFFKSGGTFSGGVTVVVESVSESTNTILFSGAGPAAANMPAANDIVFVASGAGTYGWIGDAARAYEGNICVVMEDIVFVKDTDQLSAGYIQGTFLRKKVNGATYKPSGAVESARVNTVVNSSVTKLLNFIDLET